MAAFGPTSAFAARRVPAGLRARHSGPRPILHAVRPAERPCRWPAGIAATKKLGGAVVRNQSETTDSRGFPSQQDRRPGFDIVVVPKRELLDASLTAIETEYRAHLDAKSSRTSTARLWRPRLASERCSRGYKLVISPYSRARAGSFRPAPTTRARRSCSTGSSRQLAGRATARALPPALRRRPRSGAGR